MNALTSRSHGVDGLRVHFGIAVRRLAAPLARLTPTGSGRVLWAIVVVGLVASAVPATAQEPTTTTTTTSTSTTTTSTTSTTSSTTTTIPTTTSSGSAATTSTAPSDGTIPPTTTQAPDEDLPPADSLLPGEAAALDPDEIAALAELQEQYDELIADEARLLTEYEIRLSRVEELNRDLAVVDREIARTIRRVKSAQLEIDRITGVQRANEARRRETEVELDEARDRLRRQAVDAYVHGSTGADQALELVVDTGDPHTVDVAMTYANVVVDNQRVTVNQVNALETRLARLGEAIEAGRALADEAQRELEELEQELEGQRAGFQADRDQAESERLELERMLAVVRARKAEYDQRLFAMDIESSNIGTVLSTAQRDQERAESIPLMRGPLDTPIEPPSGFGRRIHPIFGTVRQHNGMDMGGDIGDPIRTIAAGIVVIAEERTGYGNAIVIDHGDRLASVYAHLSRFEVEVGDEVARGELIGRIGSTGWSTGPHLHLEIRVAGTPVDPILYLVDNEPLECELLVASNHAIDQEILARRDDCPS